MSPGAAGAGAAKQGLHFAMILGSTRVGSAPPSPVNLGRRVGLLIERAVLARGHTVDVIDPIVEDLPLLQQPHFAYSKSTVPPTLATLADRLAAADGYLMVTPEYNHAPSPALLNLLNHFGSSIFSFKPSGIISYSAGQWGGTRAAHALRPTLSELGCLPVSAMVHVPKAQAVLQPDGRTIVASEQQRWDEYAGRTLSQLQWWAAAAKTHTEQVDPRTSSPALTTNPAQRNAPGLGGSAG